jgi:hypothetical protein
VDQLAGQEQASVSGKGRVVSFFANDAATWGSIHVERASWWDVGGVEAPPLSQFQSARFPVQATRSTEPLLTYPGLKDHPEARGYSVEVRWGHVQGIDIVATGLAGRVVIEAKGEAMLQPQQVNYFLGSIGELVQRLDEPTATYALALPDNPQFSGLVKRLPALARERVVQRI